MFMYNIEGCVYKWIHPHIVELDCELFDVMLGNTGEEEHSF